MSDGTGIEWSDATWSPTVGCTKVSPGCKHCYAETMHGRLTKMGKVKYTEPFSTVKPWPAHLEIPLKWRKPRRVFVNSMSDLFHEDVPAEYIAQVLGVMEDCPQHTFQVLTKRPERARDFLATVGMCAGADSYPSNMWLGVSVEDQKRADERIPILLQTPAAVRFLSCEPLLRPIMFPGDWWCPRCEEHLSGGLVTYQGKHDAENCGASVEWDSALGAGKGGTPGIDWIIVGGESGPGARPCALGWIESIVDQCRAAAVPAFVKQIGANVITSTTLRPPLGGKMVSVGGGLSTWRSAYKDQKGGDPAEWPEAIRVREFPAAR